MKTGGRVGFEPAGKRKLKDLQRTGSDLEQRKFMKNHKTGFNRHVRFHIAGQHETNATSALQRAIRRWLPRPETALQLPDLSPREVAYQVTDK